MKKLILSSAMLMALSASAQVFVGFAGSNKGYNLSAGVLSEAGLQIDAAYQFPLLRADVPSIGSITLGQRFRLSHHEQNEDGDTDDFTLTPAIGYGIYSVDDFTAYDADLTAPIKHITDFKPMFKLELGKDLYHGRFFAAINYCGTTYFTFGIKGFIK